jgi:hypothetical protein
MFLDGSMGPMLLTVILGIEFDMFLPMGVAGEVGGDVCIPYRGCADGWDRLEIGG